MSPLEPLQWHAEMMGSVIAALSSSSQRQILHVFFCYSLYLWINDFLFFPSLRSSVDILLLIKPCLFSSVIISRPPEFTWLFLF